MSIFTVSSIKNYLEFKWNEVGYIHHISGFIIHVLYLIALTVYVHNVYLFDGLNQDLANIGTGEQKDNFYVYILALTCFYPVFYEISQCVITGPVNYFSDIHNYNNMIFIVASAVNVIISRIWPPFNMWCKLTLLIVITLSVLRTFEFMRIFSLYSSIVTMLFSVMKDLTTFIMFFFISIILFSLVFGVIQIANDDWNHNSYMVNNMIKTLILAMGDFEVLWSGSELTN